MEKNDKKLLLRYLCMALPYKVKVCLYERETCILLGIDGCDMYLDVDSDPFRIESIKPYLRPMSSMTEEEWKEYKGIDDRSYSCPMDYAHIPASDRIDWLLAHHFDFRNLIKRGFALEAPKGMYNS